MAGCGRTPPISSREAHAGPERSVRTAAGGPDVVASRLRNGNEPASQRVTARSHHLLESTLHRSLANSWLIRPAEPTDGCRRAALDTLQAANLCSGPTAPRYRFACGTIQRIRLVGSAPPVVEATYSLSSRRNGKNATSAGITTRSQEAAPRLSGALTLDIAMRRARLTSARPSAVSVPWNRNPWNEKVPISLKSASCSAEYLS